jgi:hypothetical protein
MANIAQPWSILKGRRHRRRLGSSEDLVWWHPFPGPGIAIRDIGDTSTTNFAGRDENGEVGVARGLGDPRSRLDSNRW